MVDKADKKDEKEVVQEEKTSKLIRCILARFA
jgi:hypothetical protein